MENREIVEINGKKYVRFNKDEQPNVKVGDVITFVENSRLIPFGAECTIMNVEWERNPRETVFVVKCPNGESLIRYPWRFGVPLVEEDVVVCKDAKGTKLAFGIVYVVVDRKKGCLRVKGFGVWFRESRFVKQGEQPIAPAPKIDEHQKNLTELAKNVGNNAGTASYRVVHQNGDVSDHIRDVCHARLFSHKESYEFSPIKAIYLNFNGHLPQFETDEERVSYAQYLDYVVNESPWKSAFIPRNKEVMELGGIRRKGAEKLFLVSTTHGGETCSIAAALATMDEFEQHDVVGYNQRMGQRFIDGVRDVLHAHDLQKNIRQMQFNWHASLGYFDHEGNNSFELRTLFHQELIARGILFQGIFCPHYSHTEEDIQHILDAMNDACVVFKKALDEGCGSYLIGEAIKPVFRRII